MTLSGFERFEKKHPLRRVKGKYGEPEHWDGFSVLFALMVREDRSGATRSEMGWYEALTKEPDSSESK